MDKLIADFLDLCKKMSLNNMGQCIGITQMEEALVPHEYGMEATSHNDPISYCK
jgi:hypothetical protein